MIHPIYTAYDVFLRYRQQI